MATNLQKEFSLANLDSLFKVSYKKYYDNTFNSSTPTWSQITKTNDFRGKRLEFPAPLGFKGGVGSGSLPETANATYGDVQITSKKVYAVDRVDRESIYASGGDGAFVPALNECIKKTVEADMWNHSRILFGTGDGCLGKINTSGVTDNGGGNYSLVVSASGGTATDWKEANFEENMFVNIETGNTDLFQIQSVTPSTHTIVVQRQSGGTQVPAATDEIFLQGSEDNDPHGLKQVCDATSGTMYNVTVGRRWQSYQKAVTSGITTDLLNHMMTQVEKQCGTPPKMIVTSYVQWEKVLNLLEDDKRYSLTTMSPKAENLVGKISFNGVQFMSSQGAVKIFPERFCETDRVYFLNTDHIKYFRRPNSGWVKDDIGGNGYLRVADEDQFEARFATYGDIFIAPPFQGVLTGLTA